MSLLRKFGDGWKAFGHIMGHIQTAILLSVIYHIAIGPIALIGRAMRQPFLEFRARQSTSYADQLVTTSSTMERALKQY